MNTTLCPGTGCAKADTCLRAVRYGLEPNAPNRSPNLLDEQAWKPTGYTNRDGTPQIRECLYYYEDNGKRTSREPNHANLIGDYINERWPGLKQFPHAWVTGSTVWRVAYTMPIAPESDLDVFVCDDRSYLHVVAFFRDQSAPAPADKPKRRGSNEGERLHTTRGWVDIWLPRPVNAEDGAIVDDPFGPSPVYDPFHALRQYPPSTHGHCRVAYNPYSRALITIANEDATDEGALELHERAAQWHIATADRLYQLAKRSA